MPSKAEHYAEFEGLGEAVVREKFNLGLIAGRKRTYADEWLRALDASRAERAERREATMNTIKLTAAIMAAVATAVIAIVGVITYLSN